jgi:hypothetical protein
LNQKDFITILSSAIKNQIATAVSLPKELSQFLKNAEQQEIYTELKGIRLMLQKFYRLAKIFLLMLFFLLAMFSLKFSNDIFMLKILNWIILIGTPFILIKTYLQKPS